MTSSTEDVSVCVNEWPTVPTLTGPSVRNLYWFNSLMPQASCYSKYLTNPILEEQLVWIFLPCYYHKQLPGSAYPWQLLRILSVFKSLHNFKAVAATSTTWTPSSALATGVNFQWRVWARKYTVVSFF